MCLHWSLIFFCSLYLGFSTWSIFYVSNFRDSNFSDWWCWKFRSSELSRRCHLPTVRWIVGLAHSGSSSRRRLDKFKFTTFVLPGADKSLARPGRKQVSEPCLGRAISTKSRRELSSSFFPWKTRRRRTFTPLWQKH